jgi:hypothetical protein
MNNLIKIDEKILNTMIPKRDYHLLKYTSKYPKRLERMENLLRDGELSQSQCCKYANFPSTTYFLILKYAELIFNYCEENNIDYENSEYYEIIKAWKILDKAYIDGQIKGMRIISEAAKDRFSVDENGKEFLVKKGDWKAQAFLLKYSRKNEFGDVEDDSNSGNSGVTINIEIPKEYNLKDIALSSQKHLIDKSKE